MDDRLLTAGLLQQLRAALPPLDVLKKLADAAKTRMDEMPEGEQVREGVELVIRGIYPRLGGKGQTLSFENLSR